MAAVHKWKLMNSFNYKRSSIFIFIIATIILFLNILLTFHNPPFTPDSWSYYELSKNIFNDFYKINTFRQYHYPSSYSTSFPPLFPFFIGILNKILDIGIYANFIISIFFSIACIIPLYLLIKNHIGDQLESFFYFSIIWLSLITNSYFLEEVIAGRTIPIAIFFALWIATFITRNQTIDIRSAILIGFVGGLGCLVRFDFIILSVTLPVILFVLTKKIRIVFLYTISLLFTLLPWIVYSYYRFGKLFISDNKIVALAATRIFVLDFYFNGVPMLWDNFHLWLIKILINFIKVIISIVITYSHLPISFFIVIVVSYILLYQFNYYKVYFLDNNKLLYYTLAYRIIKWLQIEQLIAMFFVFMISWLNIVGYIATGYGDARYFTLSILITSIFSIFLIRKLSINWSQYFIDFLRHVFIFFIILCVISSLRFPFKSAVQLISQTKRFSTIFTLNHKNLSKEVYNKIILCLGNSSRVFIYKWDNEGEGFKFGALTGITTIVNPSNWDSLTPDQKKYFFSIYDVTHVITDEPELKIPDILLESVKDCPKIYKVIYGHGH